MKKILCCILIANLLLTQIGFAGTSGSEKIPPAMKRVVENGYFGVGGLNLERYANRAEFATIALRFKGISEEKVKAAKATGPYKDTAGFQGGWAQYHIGMAYEEGLMFGTGADTFSPGGNVTYIQLLAVMLRLLGYEDGADFHQYPKDYHEKAKSLGLADPKIDIHSKVTRELLGITMEKTLDLKLKHQDQTLAEKLGISSSKAAIESGPVVLKQHSFTTSVLGDFSGRLAGRQSFEGYQIGIYPKDGKNTKAYKLAKVEKNGEFTLSGFPIGLVEKLTGYQYKVYTQDNQLVLQGDL